MLTDDFKQINLKNTDAATLRFIVRMSDTLKCAALSTSDYETAGQCGWIATECDLEMQDRDFARREIERVQPSFELAGV